MQRLFSMFPTGFPGAALLLLRFSVALAVLLQGSARQEDLPVWVAVALLSAAILLLVGLLTPILAILALVVQFMGALHSPWLPRGLDAILMLNAMALALLGPGAYSLDARRFGRRVVQMLPHEDE
jgi:uncharacterized membrane protein YphA (DoxX/SURF4 family)